MPCDEKAMVPQGMTCGDGSGDPSYGSRVGHARMSSRTFTPKQFACLPIRRFPGRSLERPHETNLPRSRLRMKELTSAVQDYLKAIHLLGGSEKMVSPVDIAARL